MTPESTTQIEAPARLLLADDQALLRHSLRIAIDREPDLIVVGEAGTGAEAIRAARELRPDLVLMDIRMPEGVTALSEFPRSCSPNFPRSRGQVSAGWCRW